MELRDRGDAAAASSLLGGLLERGREVPRRARPPGRSGVQRGRRATSARSLRNRRTNSRALTAGALQRGPAVGLDRQPPVPALPARRRAERVASQRTAPRGNALLGAAVAESRRQPGRQRRPVRDHRGRTLAPVTGGSQPTSGDEALRVAAVRRRRFCVKLITARACDVGIGALLGLRGFPVGLLLLELSGSLLDRDDDFGLLAAEAFEVEILDELGQRRLPGLLSVVVDRAELRWVHPKLTRHLHLGVGEVVALARLDPRLQLRRDRAGGLAHPAPQQRLYLR